MLGYLTKVVGDTPDVIYGICKDEKLGEDIKVTVIATGFEENVIEEIHFRPKVKLSELEMKVENAEEKERKAKEHRRRIEERRKRQADELKKMELKEKAEAEEALKKAREIEEAQRRAEEIRKQEEEAEYKQRKLFSE